MLNVWPTDINAYGFIYCIRNRVNNKLYIGQTTQSVNSRFKKHRYDSRRYAIVKNKISILYHSIHKHGEDSFNIEILAIAYSKEKLDDFEKYYIAYFKTQQKQFGYNIREGGTDGGRYPKTYARDKEISRPRKLSAEGRAILSETGKKNILKVDRKKSSEAARNYHLGKKKNPDSVEQMAKKRRKAVIATNLENGTTTTFEGVRIAARTLNLDISMISKVCKGQYQYYKKWTFNYV